MNKLFRVLQFAALAMMLWTPSHVNAQKAEEESEELNLDFTLVNKTGWAIKEIYCSPTNKDNWGKDLLKRPLEDGKSIDVTFESNETAKKWDLRIVWVDEGKPVVWRGKDLTEISKITLYYNPKTDVTSAKTE